MQTGSLSTIWEYSKIWVPLAQELVQHAAAGQDQKAHEVCLQLKQAYEKACTNPKFLEEFDKHQQKAFVDTINGVKRSWTQKHVKGRIVPRALAEESKVDAGTDALLKEYLRNEIFRSIDSYLHELIYLQDTETFEVQKQKKGVWEQLFSKKPPKKRNLAEALQHGDIDRVKEILATKQRCINFFYGTKSGRPCFFVTPTLQLPNSHLPRNFLQQTNIIKDTEIVYRSLLHQSRTVERDTLLTNLKEIIKCMCSMGVDINHPDQKYYNHSILCEAPVDLIPFLLEQKADVDQRSEDEAKALPIAYFAARCDQQTVVVLIKWGSKISNINANGDNVLHVAINPTDAIPERGMRVILISRSSNNSIDAFVQQLVKHDPELLLEKNKQNNIPLVEAIYNNLPREVIVNILELHRKHNKDPDEITKEKILYFLIQRLNKKPRMANPDPGREKRNPVYDRSLIILKLLILEWGEPTFSDPKFLASLNPVVQQDLNLIIQEAKQRKIQKPQEIRPFLPGFPNGLLGLVVAYSDGVFINCDLKPSTAEDKQATVAADERVKKDDQMSNQALVHMTNAGTATVNGNRPAAREMEPATTMQQLSNDSSSHLTLPVQSL